MRTVVSLLAALTASAGVPAAAGSLDAIDWWEGDVEAAFATAREQDKPLFLYWGAVWCPPCNQIKKTIFTRREFQEKMKVFLPVYLDGDTEQAQVWGERLGAKGYPTMMVFSPQGEEVMRLPTGLQVAAFNQLLDESLGLMKPVAQVLDDALGRGPVTDAAYRLLAYYSWGQDTAVNLTTAEREQAMAKLEAKVPAKLKREKARLFALWLNAAISRSDDPEDEFALTDAQREQADQRLRAILADPERTMATIEFVLYYAGGTVKALHPKSGPGRTRLVEAWERTASRIENDSALSVDERLSALVPALEFLQLERGRNDLPPSFREHVAERVRWADDNAEDAFTRQATMSTAGWLLRQVGLDEEAHALYTAQLEKAVSPHYFMSSLARLAKKDGDVDGAVGWLRKAYDSAEGRATRFQWGTNYLLGLIELTPKDAKTIEAESLRVFRQLVAMDDAFAGRNHKRAERLTKRFADWNEGGKRAAYVNRIREAMLPACAQLSDDASGADGADRAPSMRSRCTEFFAELGSKPEETS